MWLIHEDEVHFDLIINKDSILAKQELLFNESDVKKHVEKTHTKQTNYECEKCEGKYKTERELHEHLSKMHNSGNTYNCENCEINFKTEYGLKIHTEKFHENKEDSMWDEQVGPPGPGYMGWKIPDGNIEENKKLEEMEQRIVELEKEKKDIRKEMNVMKKDMMSLKEKYKQCMEALMKETYDKNKAEILCKILREKIETEKEKEEINREVEAENSELDMSVDDEDSWKVQRKSKRNKQMEKGKEMEEHKATDREQCEKCTNCFGTVEELRKHLQNVHAKQNRYGCNKCEDYYKTKDELNNHIKYVHENSNPQVCEKCKEKFKLISELDAHIKRCHVRFSCNQCSGSYVTEHDLKNHLDIHTNKNIEASFPCQKCNKIYSTMSKLRRHDWRCHREIMCNRCDNYLPSREDLKTNRESEHEMKNKVFCRFQIVWTKRNVYMCMTNLKIPDSVYVLMVWHVVTSLVNLVTKSTKKIKSCVNSKGIAIG